MNHLKKITDKLIVLTALIAALSLAVAAQGQQLTLQEAINFAREHNRSLNVSRLEISRAHQQSRITRSKGLPGIHLNGQYAHYFNRPVFFGLGGDPQENESLQYMRVGGEEQFAAAVSLVQPLFDPSLKPDLDRARLQESRSKLALNYEETEVVASVKQTYLRVLVLQERLKLQRESLKRNKKVLDDARLLYLQGRALRVDTLRAYTTVKNLQPDLLKLTEAINTAKLQLTTLVGIESERNIELSDSLFIQTIDVIPTVETVYEEAVKSRPDLQIFAVDEKMAHEQVALSRAGKLPSLSLVGQYQLQTQRNDMRLDNARWPSVSFAGLQLNIPLYNGSSHTSRVKEAKLAEQQSVLQRTDALEQLKVEVREVVASLHETAERLTIQRPVKETAQLSYDITQFRYEKGVASRLELTDAELALTTAQSNYLEAVYDYLSAHIQLERVVGGRK